MKTYRIKDWDKHYETAETRKLVSLRWLPIPNKHDGLGFRRIAAQSNAAELFTAWILILQVASKGRGPEERGNLLRGQEALGDEDLAIMTGFPKAIFTAALDFFSSSKQGWLLVHEDELPLSAGVPAESPAKAGSSPAVWNGMEGKEGREYIALPPKAESARDVLFDALSHATGRDPLQLTKTEAAKCAAALAEIKAACPELDAPTIYTRAARYAHVMPPKSKITPHALAANWALCGTVPPVVIAASQDGPKGWRDTLVALYPDSTYEGPWTVLPESRKAEVVAGRRASA